MPYLDKTFEHYCSGQYFWEKYSISGKQMFEKAIQSDKKALHAFETFGTHLGEALKMILFALSPQAIFLGGSVCQAFPIFKDSMWETLKSFPYEKTLMSLVLEPTKHPNIAVLGAAALCFDNQGVPLEEVFQLD